MNLSALSYKLSAFLVFVMLGRGMAAEENSSLSESRIEGADTKVTAAAVTVSENEEFRRQLSLARESVKTLTESLTTSNKEAKASREKYSDLQLRVEALGLESANSDRAKLEQRLLNASADLRLMQKEREQYRDQLLGLSEAALHLLKTSTGGDSQARLEVEAQLRSANGLATKSRRPAKETATLMDAKVISVKEEWSLVVGNIGEKQGVKVGMPMRVMQDGKVIATLRVVELRQRICGAVIQEMGSGKIKVGDRLQADARQDMSLKTGK